MAIAGFEGVEAGGDADVARGEVDTKAEAGDVEGVVESDCGG